MTLTATTHGPVQRRGSVVSDAILAATIETIAERASTTISIEEVAARAGVNKTTVYRRWPTRDALVGAAITSHAHATIPIPNTGDLREDLIQLCALVRDAVGSTVGRALMAATRQGLDPEVDRARDRFWTQRFEAAGGILARAADRGECAPMADRELLIELLVAPIHFRLVELARAIDNDFITDLVDRFLGQIVATGAGS